MWCEKKGQYPDYVALAQSMGVEGERVEKVEELIPALECALHSKRTSVVEILCSAPTLPHTKFKWYRCFCKGIIALY